MSVDSYVNFELLPMLVTKKSNVLCDHSNCFENQPAMNGLFTAAGGHFQSKARSSRGNGILTTGFSNHLAKISRCCMRYPITRSKRLFLMTQLG